jgi:hypothetical protein
LGSRRAAASSLRTCTRAGWWPCAGRQPASVADSTTGAPTGFAVFAAGHAPALLRIECSRGASQGSLQSLQFVGISAQVSSLCKASTAASSRERSRAVEQNQLWAVPQVQLPQYAAKLSVSRQEQEQQAAGSAAAWLSQSSSGHCRRCSCRSMLLSSAAFARQSRSSSSSSDGGTALARHRE